MSTDGRQQQRAVSLTLKRGHSNTIPAQISFNDFREEINM
jgi:hypothetical protein